MKRQVYNPYLPSYEYIPDGEPHVFGDRIYLYGSHDRFDGANFCLNDYVCYSAPVDDLTDWRYEGVIYRKDQDPRNQNIPADAPANQPLFGVEVKGEDSLNPPGVHAMWAPDVVRGYDGRYYLYYCLDFLNAIAVAVCDTPAGQYEFHGYVRHKDGSILGQRDGDWMQFDPGVFNDDGEIYLYSGGAPFFEGDTGKGSQVMTLEADMLTLKTEPKALLGDIYFKENDFTGHEFFEASSIRKIDGKYYFVYSSMLSHELCYAVSDRPDGGYRFGGTVVDIGDIGLDGRTENETVNCLGNTHGGIECCNGQWYIFYHRQTNETQFSRQACAEKIYFDEDGAIKQVEITSCGLNDGPLKEGMTYPARIACHLNRYGSSVLSIPEKMQGKYPYFTQDIKDAEPSTVLDALDATIPIQYIANIKDGTCIGYKYFDFCETEEICMNIRGTAKGIFRVSATEHGSSSGEIAVDIQSDNWTKVAGKVSLPKGKCALYFHYKGEGTLEFIDFTLC